MKRILYITLIISPFIFSNCRKGENDPFISVSSRKARISNDWTIQQWNELKHQTGNQQGGGAVDYKYEHILNQSTYNYTVPNNSLGILGGVDNGTVESAKFIIKKDGTWERKLNYSYSSQSFTKNFTEETSGKWNFLGKGNDYKNKERVVFNTLSSYKKEVQILSDGTTLTKETKQNFNNGDLSLIFEIDQLKSKEVILKRTTSSDVLTPTNNTIFETTESYILIK